MGRASVEDMLNHADFEITLSWHLQHNHYPPVNLVFMAVCRDAIERANNDDYEKILELPNGKMMTVGEIIDGLHLDAFLEDNE